MKFGILICLILFLHLGFGQGVSKSDLYDSVEKRLEYQASENNTSEDERDHLQEIMEYYAKRRIQLDSNCREHLSRLGLLNEIQIRAVMIHIKAYGRIQAEEELIRIKHIDDLDIKRIMPFISFEEAHANYNEIDKRVHHDIRVRYALTTQKSKGYQSSIFQGNRIYQNYTYRLKYLDFLSAGLNLEKDAGERLFFNSSNCFDFQSAYIYYHPKTNIEEIIVGDYSASFAQGLTFASSSGIGKSSEVLLIKKSRDGFRPHTSADEFHYLRGAAITYKRKKLRIRPFYSNRFLDANLSLENPSTFSSLYSSGLHRTASEISKRKKVRRQLGGVDLNWRDENLEVGMMAVSSKSSHKMLQNNIYETHLSEQNFSLNTGAYFNLYQQNYDVFGEISRSINNGLALMAGGIIMPYKFVSLAFSMRKFDVDHQNISGNAFSENSVIANEIGIYQAIRIKLARKLEFSAYADNYKFPWPKYRIDQSSGGQEYFSSFVYDISKSNQILIQVRWSENEKSLEWSQNALSNLAMQVRKNLRIQYSKAINEHIRIRSRIEFSEFLIDSISDQGVLMFNEIKFQSMSSPLSFLVRLTIFDTESYSSRIYAYEQDLRGSSSIPSFSGKGSKTILLLNWKIAKKLVLSFKFAHLTYDDRKLIGSGLDEIANDHKSELKFQIQFKI